MKKILLLSCLFLLSGCGLFGGDGKISKEFLEKHIIEGELQLGNLGLTKVPDFKKFLSSTGANLISSIYLGGNKIKNIDGEKFKIFKNLKKLSLSFNKISSTKGVEFFTGLEDFSISQNNLKNLDGINKMKKLLKLEVNFNKIENISGIENLEKLQILFLAHNKIKSLKVLEKIKSLTYVKAEFNEISDISGFLKHKNLEILTIKFNKLKESLTNKLYKINVNNLNLNGKKNPKIKIWKKFKK